MLYLPGEKFNFLHKLGPILIGREQLCGSIHPKFLRALFDPYAGISIPDVKKSSMLWCAKRKEKSKCVASPSILHQHKCFHQTKSFLFVHSERTEDIWWGHQESSVALREQKRRRLHCKGWRLQKGCRDLQRKGNGCSVSLKGGGGQVGRDSMANSFSLITSNSEKVKTKNLCVLIIQKKLVDRRTKHLNETAVRNLFWMWCWSNRFFFLHTCAYLFFNNFMNVNISAFYKFVCHFILFSKSFT